MAAPLPPALRAATLQLLAEAELTVPELEARLNVSRPALRRLLEQLAAAGMVDWAKDRREGPGARARRYRLARHGCVQQAEKTTGWRRGTGFVWQRPLLELLARSPGLNAREAATELDAPYLSISAAAASLRSEGLVAATATPRGRGAPTLRLHPTPAGLSALADPTRLQPTEKAQPQPPLRASADDERLLLSLLAQRPWLTVEDLTVATGRPRRVVAGAARQLADAGQLRRVAVRSGGRGQRVSRYKLTDAGADRLAGERAAA
jgi:predicted transcriptional regulator